MVLARASTQFERLLWRTADQLQLPPSLHAKARNRYKALAIYLQARLQPFVVNVYPQGSYRIGTTVKPLHGEEFDIDVIVEVAGLPNITPQGLFDLIARLIADSPHYAPLVKPKPNCIRLVYADEFHIDIVPAIPNKRRGDTAIMITHVENGLMAWRETDPRAFAAWFGDQSMKILGTKAVQVEPLPPVTQTSDKSEIQVCVQLIKRSHHVCVDDELRSASIVFTALAGEACAGADSVEAAMSALCRTLEAYASPIVPIPIRNPGAPYEIINEKWGRAAIYAAFQEHVARFLTDWDQVVRIQGLGYQHTVDLLKTMFGEIPVHTAVKSLAEETRVAREAGLLSTTPRGALVVGSSARPIRNHNFFGG